jgi:hypothetical protein
MRRRLESQTQALSRRSTIRNRNAGPNTLASPSAASGCLTRAAGRKVLRGGLGLGGCRRDSRWNNCPERFNRIKSLIDFLLPMPYVGVDVETEAVRASA